NPARIGLIRTASTNQPKPLRPLLLAQIPMAMETPNQNKSISMSFPAHRLAAFYGFAYCRDLPIIPNSRPKHNNGINFRIQLPLVCKETPSDQTRVKRGLAGSSNPFFGAFFVGDARLHKRIECCFNFLIGDALRSCQWPQ